jgi:hypothetical protein
LVTCFVWHKESTKVARFDYVLPTTQLTCESHVIIF